MLKEWENGPYMPAHFTHNLFADIYHRHIRDLMYIKEWNADAYVS